MALSRLRALVKAGTAQAVRNAAGLSVAEVSRNAQVNQRTVYRWERGLSVPHGEGAIRYALLLDRLMGRQS